MTVSGPSDPPRWVERLFRACLPTGTVGDSIVGDAREEFHLHVREGGLLPSLWYCHHALAVAGPYILEAVMDTLLKDIKFGARSLTRQAGSAVISVLILALGIGLSTFMFSVIYGVFFRGLDVPAADRIAVFQGLDTRLASQNGVGISSQDYLEYRDGLRSFDEVAGYFGGTVNLSDAEGPERFQGLWVTANIFQVVQAAPVLGRAFSAGDDAPGLPPSVVIGHHVWRDRYGSDPDVVGRSVRVNGRQGTIVGVMQEGFQWPSNHDVWITMDDDPRATERGQGTSYQIVGLLAEDVSWEQAGLETARLASRLEQDYPDTNEGVTIELQTVSQSQNGDEIVVIFSAMMVAVLLVLLVACANVANLLLARAAMRMREAGVRVALGAGRARVMVPFLAEAFVLAVGAALLGTGLAYWAVHVFDAATATPLTGRPYYMQFTVDLPVLLYVVGITALTALLAGVAPALQVSRTDVNSVLKDESRGSSSLHLGRLSRGLVMVEVALSVALLVGAGLMTKSIVQLSAHEMPFDEDAFMSSRAGLFEADYPAAADRRAFWERAEREIRARPEVAAVALASSVPGTGSGSARIRLEGQTYDEPGDRPRTHYEVVSPGYFEVLGAGPVEGRVFTDQDTDGGQRVAVVNRSFAERFWPGASALGRQFRMGTADTIPYLTVVGVVPDLQMEGFQPKGSPSSIPDGFYRPIGQVAPSFMSIVARPAAGDPSALAPVLRDVVRGIDADLPLYQVKTVAEEIFESSWFYTVFGVVFIVFGVAALFMASVGLYGVLSFSVSRRTREMGLRMALGAESRDVTRIVLRQGAVQIGVGLAVGLVLAALVSQAVGMLMYQVDPQDPVVFGSVVGLISVVGLVASLVPARRATQVDPVVALGAE